MRVLVFNVPNSFPGKSLYFKKLGLWVILQKGKKEDDYDGKKISKKEKKQLNKEVELHYQQQQTEYNNAKILESSSTLSSCSSLSSITSNSSMCSYVSSSSNGGNGYGCGMCNEINSSSSSLTSNCSSCTSNTSISNCSSSSSISNSNVNQGYYSSNCSSSSSSSGTFGIKKKSRLWGRRSPSPRPKLSNTFGSSSDLTPPVEQLPPTPTYPESSMSFNLKRERERSCRSTSPTKPINRRMSPPTGHMSNTELVEHLKSFTNISPTYSNPDHNKIIKPTPIKPTSTSLQTPNNNINNSSGSCNSNSTTTSPLNKQNSSSKLTTATTPNNNNKFSIPSPKKLFRASSICRENSMGSYRSFTDSELIS